MVKGGDSMKKLLGCFLSVMLVVCFAGPVAANTLVPSVGGFGSYWDGAAENHHDIIHVLRFQLRNKILGNV